MEGVRPSSIIAVSRHAAKTGLGAAAGKRMSVFHYDGCNRAARAAALLYAGGTPAFPSELVNDRFFRLGRKNSPSILGRTCVLGAKIDILDKINQI